MIDNLDTGILVPWENNKRVAGNPYAANPLIDVVKAQHPELITAQSKLSPMPTMFVTGDLPPFTASGIDPEILNQFPWSQRHAMATDPDRAHVLRMLEEYADQPDYVFSSSGLTEYVDRVWQWLLAKPAASFDPDQTYKDLFGDA